MILSNGTPIPLQALAENVPMLSTGYWYADDTMDTLARHSSYAQLYRSEPVISGVIDKISESMAQLTLRVFDITDPESETVVYDNDYAKLLKDPCPIMRPYEFYRYMISTYELYGESYAVKVRAGGAGSKVLGLVPMHPSRVAVKRDEDSNETFVFTLGVASAGILTVDRSEVLAWRRFNQDNVMRGESRLRSLQSTMINEEAARRAITSWWTKGGAPSGVLSVADGKLSPESRSRLKAQFDQRHTGAGNMGGTVLLEAGTTYTPTIVNAQQLQFIETRKYSRGEIFSRYDIPAPVMQVTDEATFSNITEQFRSLYRESLSYRIVDFQDLLDGDLRPEFSGPGKLEARLDQDEALLGPVETRSTVAIGLVTNGIAKPSEVRPWFGFSKVTDTDVADALYANQALAPLGTLPAAAGAASADPNAVGAPTGDPDDPFGVNNAAPMPDADPNEPAKPAPEVTTRSIMGLVGRVVKSGDQTALRQQLMSAHEAAIATTVQANAKSLGGDEALAKTVANLTSATVTAAGAQTARKLGGKYDGTQLSAYVQRASKSIAAGFNAKTAEELQARAEASPKTSPSQIVDDYYANAMPARVKRLSESLVTQFAALAVMNAGQQSDATQKTWRSSSDTGRHAHLDGETVGIEDGFSNGMKAPGDPVGGYDQTADCHCTLEVSR